MLIDDDKKDMWLVYLYAEKPILTNILNILSRYKKRMNGWPRKIGYRRGNRLQFGFGSDTRVEKTDWMVLSAIYLSTYEPIPDIAKDGRVATEFSGKRTPIEDTTGIVYRYRR